MSEWIRTKRSVRAALLLGAAAVFAAGALYLYFHDPYQYPLPCIIKLLTGLYCPGCGAGRACFSILHGKFFDAFCYNPLLVILLPFAGGYIAARGIDWAVTGGNHIDGKISIKLLLAVLIIILVYGILRNTPIFPFSLLAPGGIKQIL
ncbi:MAG TPA: DUF2752 domain-containing protein [Candidatus Mediterraneibacter stercoravium]|uniref:DUF2752 domain-containing protein n=1 Tax=Candidatus Mediterraneibacter stercoravium TaxID=2838685 RepID=A0A9D2GAD3_9FIRM|nr:DUF2752 domain-containing protein [Candidatus Mediterraneibacter stercoravium]